MCGIAGIVALDGRAAGPERIELERMAGALAHRGPDEFGLYRDRRAGLAHARLSIIDLSTGAQPLSNEDGSLWIAFNGEIFNYLELRRALAARGHAFRTQSDTEVIVHAFEEWGAEAFARFNGQWAAALWNARSGELTLARDRLGVRPLHLLRRDGRLYFASEAKAIFAADRAIPRRIDPRGLDDVFTFWSCPAPRTCFEGVEELPPGTWRSFVGGAERAGTTWTPRAPRSPAEERQGTPEEAAAAVRAALEEATSLRMLRADVPVGSYLSGGLDSSLVAALGLRAKGARFKTFSLRFADAEYDETPHQRLIAERLGSEHAEVVVERRDIAAVFPDVVRCAEKPLLRTAPAPMFLLSGLVRREGIKVVLTGEGADELFAGYDLFREAKVRRFWARRPDSRLRPLLLEKLYPYLARSPVAQRAMARAFFGRGLDRWRCPGFGHAPRWSAAAALKKFFSADVKAALAGRDAAGEFLATLPAEFGDWSFLAQDQYIEIRTLLSPYLLSSQGDRMLMGHSVEGRFPFLDRDVVELALSLPDRFKLDGLEEKLVLKRAAEGLVPPEIIARRKQPYRAPDALAFAGADAPPWVSELLSPEAVRAAGLFDPALVERLWAKCRAGGDRQFSQADNMALVGVLSAQSLHLQLVREFPDPARPVRWAVVEERPA